MKTYHALSSVVLAVAAMGCSSGDPSPVLTPWTSTAWDEAWGTLRAGDGACLLDQSQNIKAAILGADNVLGADAFVQVTFEEPLPDPYDVTFGAEDATDRPVVALASPEGFRIYVADVKSIEAHGLVVWSLAPSTPVHALSFAVGTRPAADGGAPAAR